jgi:hypothetical protein
MVEPLPQQTPMDPAQHLLHPPTRRPLGVNCRLATRTPTALPCYTPTPTCGIENPCCVIKRDGNWLRGLKTPAKRDSGGNTFRILSEVNRSTPRSLSLSPSYELQQFTPGPLHPSRCNGYTISLYYHWHQSSRH